jgi:hypothetical protein
MDMSTDKVKDMDMGMDMHIEAEKDMDMDMNMDMGMDKILCLLSKTAGTDIDTEIFKHRCFF